MDYKIIISDPAIRDLEEIVRFIARHDQAAAGRFGQKLIANLRHLAKFPRFGRVVPERGDENIREIVFRSYRVFYRVKDEERLVEIARFGHAAGGKPEIPGEWEF